MAVNTYKQDEASVNAGKSKTVFRVLSYLKDYKKKLVLIIAMLIVCTLIVTFLPNIVERAIDVDVANSDLKGLYKTCAAGAAMCILWYLLSVTRQKMLTKITNSIVYKIRKEAFDHLQTLSLYYFDSRPAGKILSRLINDISSLKEMLTKLITTLVPNVCMVVSIVIVMLFKNWKLCLSALISLPPLMLSVYWVMIKGFKNWEAYRKKQSNLNAYSHESYAGIKVIQAFDAVQESEEEGKKIIGDLEQSWRKAVRRADLLNIIIYASQGIGYFFLYLFAVRWLKLGATSVGAIVAYATYIGLFWQPIRSLASMYNQLTNQITSAQRVFELMDTESILIEENGASELNITSGEVRFDDICFAYPDEPETEILHKLNLCVAPGSMIALVGPTGAGKTTIVNLICRFYDPVSGEVTIDGQNIKNVTIRSLRRNIGVMTQDSFLFSGTVRDNLLYGKQDATEDEMRSACRRMGIEEMILGFEKGYDTEIKMDSISQGQKQLIALARTLIADPKILLLDEATSAIDTKTEEQVQKGMAILMQGRTSFVVAHRLSTIKNADRILVVQDKGIAEDGNHRELMRQNGIYAKLYMSQFEGIN